MEFFNKIKLEHVVYRFKSFAIYDKAFCLVLQNLQSRLYLSNAVNSYHIAKLLILPWFIKYRIKNMFLHLGSAIATKKSLSRTLQISFTISARHELQTLFSKTATDDVESENPIFLFKNMQI